jgi:hypothetical protein
MIERLSETEFMLHGLPKGMMANLDTEALYESDEEGRQSERARDLRRKWRTEQGWDTYVDADGTRQSWYPGFDLPDPIKRLTRENEEAVDAEFFIYRVQKAVQASPEGAWLAERRLWDDSWVETYKTAGQLRITLQDAGAADQFAQAFAA